MNAHINERFTTKAVVKTLHSVPEKPKPALNLSIREYFKSPLKARNLVSWHTALDIPTAAEINRIDKGNEIDCIEVPINKIVGPWKDKEEYLQDHYELLREDAVAPLRCAVEEVRANPKMLESESDEHAGIYENVC